jgi:hypothetical protein
MDPLTPTTQANQGANPSSLSMREQIANLRQQIARLDTVADYYLHCMGLQTTEYINIRTQFKNIIYPPTVCPDSNPTPPAGGLSSQPS